MNKSMYVCLSKNGEDYFNEFVSPDILLEEVQTTGTILIVCTNQVNWGDRLRVTRADRQTDTHAQMHHHRHPLLKREHDLPIYQFHLFYDFIFLGKIKFIFSTNAEKTNMFKYRQLVLSTHNKLP